MRCEAGGRRLTDGGPLDKLLPPMMYEIRHKRWNCRHHRIYIGHAGCYFFLSKNPSIGCHREDSKERDWKG